MGGVQRRMRTWPKQGGMCSLRLAEQRVHVGRSSPKTTPPLARAHSCARLCTAEEEEAGKTVEDKPTDAECGEYGRFWDQFGKAIKLGIIEDATNRNRLAKLLRFHTSKSTDKVTSLDEYISRMKEGQQYIYYVAGSSQEELSKSPFVERLLKKDYEVRGGRVWGRPGQGWEAVRARAAAVVLHRPTVSQPLLRLRSPVLHDPCVNAAAAASTAHQQPPCPARLLCAATPPYMPLLNAALCCVAACRSST